MGTNINRSLKNIYKYLNSRHQYYVKLYNTYHKLDYETSILQRHYKEDHVIEYELMLLKLLKFIDDTEHNTLLNLFYSDDTDNNYIFLKLLKNKSKELEKKYSKDIIFKTDLDNVIIDYYNQILKPVNDKFLAYVNRR